MTSTSRFAILAALSAAGLGLGAAPGFAQQPQPIYGGGGSNSEPTLRLLADCGATPLTVDVSGGNEIITKTLVTSWAADCATPGGYGGGGANYKYYFTAVNSGTGLLALIGETAIGTLEPQGSSVGNGEGTVSGTGVAGSGVGTLPNNPTDADSWGLTATGTTYPYPYWDITISDAPANEPSPEPGSAATVNGDYNTGGYAPNGFSTKQNRGLLWSIPTGATPITIPYNLPSCSASLTTNCANFVLTPGSTDGETTKFQLSKDALCYIYTKADSAGQVVPGNYDWSNPIFLKNSFGQTYQGLTVTNPTTGAAEGSPVPINSISTPNFNGTYNVTSTFTVVPGTGAANPIYAFARQDDSGSSYLLTLWLENNCAAFNSTTLGGAVAQPNQTLVTTPAFGSQVPATIVTWPSWVYQSYWNDGTPPNQTTASNGGTLTAINASGPMAAAVTATKGSIGYVGPTNSQPKKSSGPTTAYVENNFGGTGNPLKHQYQLPNPSTVEQAITKPAPPKLSSLKNPAYGKLNTTVSSTGTVSAGSTSLTVALNTSTPFWQSAGIAAGAAITVAGAGASGNLVTTISSITYPGSSGTSIAITLTTAATTAVTGAAVTVNVPQTIRGTNAVSWGSGLNNIFFKSTLNGAYPITGLSYIYGYQCYSSATGTQPGTTPTSTLGNPYQGVLDFVAYYTNSGQGGNADADNLILAEGLVPIDYDSGANGVDTNGLKRTFTQAVYDVVASDPATKLIAVPSLSGFPTSPANGKALAGPYQCPYYATDGSHE